MNRQGHYVGPVLKQRKYARSAKQARKNITGDLRWSATKGRSKALKAREGWKPPPPNRGILQANNIGWGLGRGKGVEKGKKHIPAPEAVVLRNGENVVQGPPWGV